MIVYDLICDEDHEFESWFKNSAAYDTLRKARKIQCPVCGTAKVRKAPMAPKIAKSGVRDLIVPDSDAGTSSAQPGSAEQDDMAQAVNKAVEAIKDLQATIEKKFEDVGDKFPEEARKIHYGEAEARGIYGEATPKEAQDLIDEGVDIAAVPWVKRKLS